MYFVVLITVIPERWYSDSSNRFGDVLGAVFCAGITQNVVMTLHTNVALISISEIQIDSLFVLIDSSEVPSSSFERKKIASRTPGGATMAQTIQPTLKNRALFRNRNNISDMILAKQIKDYDREKSMIILNLDHDRLDMKDFLRQIKICKSDELPESLQ